MRTTWRLRPPDEVTRKGLWRGPALVVVGAVLVAIVGALTTSLPALLGPRPSGLLALGGLLLLALYGARRRYTLLSLRAVRLLTSIPGLAAARAALIRADRLENWRTVHVALGLALALPLYWHVAASEGGPLEALLLCVMVLLTISGIAGVWFQYWLPRSLLRLEGREVRLVDVAARQSELLARAEAEILGASDALVDSYLAEIRPVLRSRPSLLRCFAWTFGRADLSRKLVARTSRQRGELPSADGARFDGLLVLATSKLELDLARAHLVLNRGWVSTHLLLFFLVTALVGGHLLAVAYYGGM